MKYLIKRLDQNRYYLLCMDYESILNYLDDIEKENLIKANAGDLIIDQLLVTGDGRNRFLACQFFHGKVKLETAKNIEGTKDFKHISLEMFKKVKHVEVFNVNQ